MKNFIFGSIIAISAFLAVFAISFSLDVTMKHNRLSASANNQISDIKTRLVRLEADSDIFVVLLEYDGIIGIYDKERQHLLGTINVQTLTLPATDRKALLDGIEVKDPEKFIGLFEDYSS